jgi:hypothetical protein
VRHQESCCPQRFRSPFIECQLSTYQVVLLVFFVCLDGYGTGGLTLLLSHSLPLHTLFGHTLRAAFRSRCRGSKGDKRQRRKRKLHFDLSSKTKTGRVMCERVIASTDGINIDMEHGRVDQETCELTKIANGRSMKLFYDCVSESSDLSQEDPFRFAIGECA